MKRTIFREQDGQVLVQVALMIFVLLLFVGLAVDVGNVYAERRAMQNAADAGALAGAREICLGNDEAAVVAQAFEYAVNQNGAEDAFVDIIDEYKVEVVATVAAGTYFIRLIPGLETVDVSARAVAGCGPGEGVCHGFPVAFHVDLWCTLSTMVDCPSCEDGDALEPLPGCPEGPPEGPCPEDTVFYIWDGDWPIDMVSDDVFGFDEIDELVIGSGHRRWLDFGKAPDEYLPECTGCGNMKCLIEYGYAGPVDIEDCVSAKPGVVDSALRNAPVDKIVPIPVYEYTCEGAESCGGDGIIVLDFACVRILGEKRIPKAESWDGKNHRVIMFQVICDNTTEECLNECARTPGGDPGPGEVTAVSLLE